MPSFDIVSNTDLAEVDNAINGSMREIDNRFDFKNSQSSILRHDNEIVIISDEKYKLEQVQLILRTHFVKRKLDTSALTFSKVDDAKGGTLKQTATIVQGIEQEVSQKINKEIKATKLKVQVAIRGQELRVSGNKRDVLQNVIKIVKDMKILQPLQFINFRD